MNILYAYQVSTTRRGNYSTYPKNYNSYEYE